MRVRLFSVLSIFVLCQQHLMIARTIAESSLHCDSFANIGCDISILHSYKSILRKTDQTGKVSTCHHILNKKHFQIQGEKTWIYLLMAERLASHYKRIIGWENKIIRTFLKKYCFSIPWLIMLTKLEGSVWLTFIADIYYFIDCLFVELLLGFDLGFCFGSWK